MYSLWIAMTYATDVARSKVRAMVKNEVGALTLEWIVIAVALVAAGAIAAGIFDKAINDEANKLP
ncbi:MAG TPA: hypothetical protein VLX31_17315 [Streptosporangiaceae bacterium]|nr:hypothetical protein [Streptosporangiaceae bacterium]